MKHTILTRLTTGALAAAQTIRTVELNELTPETLLQVLQANGMLDKSVKVQNWLVTDRDDPYRDTVLTLDLSKAFQDQLSANAATEHTILASLVNTFLDAYRATEITLTADGKPLKAKTVQTSEPFTYMNLALTPTFQTEVTMDGKQEPLTLTWASAMGCAIGYDANLLKPDPTSSIAPLAFRGIDHTDVTFTVMLSSTPAPQLVEESKEQSEYAESTVTLTRSGYQATRLTLPDTPHEKDVDYTVPVLYFLEAGKHTWCISYSLPASQQKALQPKLDAMANSFCLTTPDN